MDTRKRPAFQLEVGKMSGDIDMSQWAVKNVPAAADGGDPITKQVLERVYLSGYLKKSGYDTVFEVNVTRASKNQQIVLHGGTQQVKRIKDGRSYLHQDTNVKGPELIDGGGEPL